MYNTVMGINKTDLITAVIPNYNGISYIEACLDSILAGSFVPQIVVVDNDSTDGSKELIEEKYPMVTLLKLGANTGFCHAVNAGLHIAKTRYVVLLNNDLTVAERCIELLYSHIAQNKRAFSAQAKMLSLKDPSVIDDAGDFYCAMGWAFARGKFSPAKKHNKGGYIFSACGGAAMYRRNVFEEIGYFDERHFCYLEDVDIGYRAAIYGYRNLYVPEAIAYHAGSATTGSRHNPFKEEMTPGNNMYLIYKNMPVIQYAINAPLIHAGAAVKRHYFHKKGLGDSYEQGVMRGEILIARAQDMDWLKKRDYFYKKGSIPEEAALSEPNEKLTGIYPLYLGGKVPFKAAHLPNYLRIQKELWGNCFRRLMK